jgi:hypothetical protein
MQHSGAAADATAGYGRYASELASFQQLPQNRRMPGIKGARHGARGQPGGFCNTPHTPSATASRVSRQGRHQTYPTLLQQQEKRRELRLQRRQQLSRHSWTVSLHRRWRQCLAVTVLESGIRCRLLPLPAGLLRQFLCSHVRKGAEMHRSSVLFRLDAAARVAGTGEEWDLLPLGLQGTAPSRSAPVAFIIIVVAVAVVITARRESQGHRPPSSLWH